ncbi:TetR/AcrR family transcriptional regulator [Streptomyces flaveolus]|uniref:TetR/AcrR family transcriptional regulator n=1 Tax=Streptomyces flaveolus TaxID=67297 RepID=UPI0033B82664
MVQPAQARSSRTKQPARKPVQERSKRTRQLVLDAASRLIADHGTAGVTLQQIYTAAGVSKGSGQHAFRTKKEIALTIVQEGFSMDAAQPGKPRVQAIVDASIVLSWLTVFSPVVRAAARIATEQDHPEVFGTLWRLYVPMITKILIQAAKEGELQEDLTEHDLEKAAWHWVMTFTGYDLRFRRTVDELPRWIASMNAWAVRGIVTPETYRQLRFDVQRGLTLIAQSNWARSYISDQDVPHADTESDGTPA